MSKGKVFILQGMSGAGKSTVAKRLVEGLPQGKQVVVSADDFFIDPATGKYTFNPAKLGEAHGSCLRAYTHALIDEAGVHTDLVVVDNTNTTLGEVAPYYALAEAFGYEVTILHVGRGGSLIACSERNLHGVSFNTIHMMAERLHKFGDSMPPWWTRTTLEEFEAEDGFEALAQFKKEVL